MVAKFSARSWLNRIRWARNSASASISLITPAIDVSPLPFPAGSSAAAVELGGQLVEAYRDDIRVFRDPAGRDVLDSATERYVDTLLLHDGVDGRGERGQEAIDLPVPVGEVLGHPAEHRPQRIDGFPDRGRRHGIADALQLFTMRLEDRLPQLHPQVRGGAFLPGSGQQAVGQDGGPDGLPQGQVGGRGHGRLDGPFQLAHRLHLPLVKASWAKAYREAVENGLNFSTCSAGHSVSRYRARSSSRLAAADTPSRASLSAGDSTRRTARRPK